MVIIVDFAQTGDSPRGLGPHFWYTGSSGVVSGCNCTLPSHKAADDLDGSF